MSRSIPTVAKAAALAAAAALVLAACGNGDADTDTDTGTENGGEEGGDSEPLALGTLLPQTGSLAQLGPPEIAGVDLAVQEANENGGVLGNDVTVTHEDSSDADNAAVATQSVQSMLGNVSVIIGAASSQVTQNVIDDVVGSGTVMFSPANTSPLLSGISEYYFRTAPPDSVQGNALGNLMVGDGHQDIAILVFNESYGTGLRDVVVPTVEDLGATVTYGNSGDEFDPTEQNFGPIVSGALATDPDAIAIIAFTTQTPLIIQELVNQDFDMANTYYVDGNLQNFDGDFEDGTLEGAQGTLPGAEATEAFQERLLEVDSGLNDFSYAAESYDAAMLSILAAVAGGGTDSDTIRDNLPAVSGADGGTECTGFVECRDLLEDGEAIHYQAVSGVGPFNEANDPSSAFIGIYQFDGENRTVFQRSEYGEVPVG